MGIIFYTYEIKKQTGKFYGIVLDKSLYLLYNINKENSMKCTFVVNRPVVTTEDIETKDYAKKW